MVIRVIHTRGIEGPDQPGCYGHVADYLGPREDRARAKYFRRLDGTFPDPDGMIDEICPQCGGMIINAHQMVLENENKCDGEK